MEDISELNAEAEACFDRGYNYYSGDGGVSQGYAEALKWLLKAADLDHLDAQLILGIMYLNGNGIEPDFKEAMKWTRKAAERGEPAARSQLTSL